VAIADTSTRSPLDEARRLSPLIRSYVDEIEAERELPRPLFEALADAGLFHMLIPHSLGGTELDFPTYIQVIEELALADASTAWAINQGAIFATYSAVVAPEVAKAVWIDTPRSVMANTPAPVGTATVAEGGFRVSGRFGFSTGCKHASWLAPHARVIENGQPRLLRNGQPETRYLFVPVDRAEILDTWHVRGMRGTGTHHFTVNDVFVPEEYSFITSIVKPRVPGALYIIPRTLEFASGDAAAALAVARGALDSFLELSESKTPWRSDTLLRDQSMIQMTVGQAEADIRSGRALLTQTVREVWDAVSADGKITIDQRVSLRLCSTHAIRLAVKVVDSIYDQSGASAIFDGNPIQRRFQDVHVLSQHLQARLSTYELVGQFLLGIQTETQRL
jgi:alkylation response protein AidB-like acyl-CoA dehydrogenase